MKGWSEISEIHTMDASCHAPKKTRKQQITRLEDILKDTVIGQLAKKELKEARGILDV